MGRCSHGHVALVSTWVQVIKIQYKLGIKNVFVFVDGNEQSEEYAEQPLI